MTLLTCARFQSKELIVRVRQAPSRDALINQAGLRLAEVDQFPQLDVTIDGADEVDDDLSVSRTPSGYNG